MPNDLRASRFHFPAAGGFLKTAGKTVKGGRLDWQEEVQKMLVETAPWIEERGLEWKLAWDEFDTDLGYALGKLAVYNRPTLPAVYPAQQERMNQMGMDAPAEQAVIPIFVENQKLANLDIFIDQEGMAHRLTQKRWDEFVGQSQEIGSVDPNVPPARTNSQYSLPESASGLDRGMGTTFKTASDQQFPLLAAALPHVHPYDIDRMRKLASSVPGVVVGFAQSRTLPVVKTVLASPAMSTADYDKALVGTLPVNLIYIERKAQGAMPTVQSRYRAALVSDRYYAPRYVEGDYVMLTRALQEMVPDIEKRLLGQDDVVIQLGRRRTATPVLLDEIDFTPEKVMAAGTYIAMGRDGTVSRLESVPNCYEFSGTASGCRLFCGEGFFAMQPEAYGKLVSQHTGGMMAEQPHMAPVPKGEWVSICIPTREGHRYTVPLRVNHHVSVMGESYLCGTTYAGEPICLRFVDGIASIVSADGVPWPDLAQGSGYAPMLAPGHARVVRLGQQIQLMDDPDEVAQRLRSYVVYGDKYTGGTQMRFDEGEAPRYLVIKFIDGEFHFSGRIAEPITGQDETPDLSAGMARFVLSVLGCTDEQASSLLSKAEARGRITVAGLSPVKRVMEEGGKVNVEFIEKMGELAVRLRDQVSDDHRDTMFKAASTIDVDAIGAGVRKLLRDEHAVAKLASHGAAVAKIALIGGEAGIEKLAEVFSNPESIDVMLGLNVINERNVTTFLRNLPRLKQAEDNLAELLMMARQGLSGVNPDDISEGLKSINEVVESLEFMDTKISAGRAHLPRG